MGVVAVDELIMAANRFDEAPLYPDRMLEYASFRCWMDNGCYSRIDENRST